MTERVQVIAPYHVQRAPLETVLRKTFLYSIIIPLAMIYGFFYTLLPPAFLIYLATPLAILVVIVIWALPDRDTAPPAKVIEFLFFAYLVALIAWPVYLAIALPGLPWITFTRAFSGPMALLLLVAVSTSAEFRSDAKAALLHSPWILWLLVGFVTIQVLTLPFSSTPFTSFKKLLDAQFEWTVIFFAGVYVFLRPGAAQRWATWVCILAAFIALMGLAEARNGQVLWAGHIPTFLKIADESVQRTIAGASRAAIGIHRVQGTFTTSLSCAEFLAFSTPFLLYLVQTAKHFAMRLFALVALPLVLYVIMLTQSRLGMVGFIMAILLYILFWGWRRWKRDRADLLGPAVIVGYPAIFAAFIGLTFASQRLHNMVWGSGAHQASNEGRITQWMDALPKIAANPLGYGVGRGAETLGATNGLGVVSIDSYYLTILLEYGILGFLVYYGMMLIATGKAMFAGLEARDEETMLLGPLAIVVSIFFVVKSVLSQDQTHPLIFAILGMIVALRYRAAFPDAEAIRRGAAR